MARLIDDLRASGKLGKPWWVPPHRVPDWQRHAGRCFELLRSEDLTVLDIDNVAQYYFNGTDQERWSVDKDFPNLAPPFELSWFEHRLTTKIRSKECGDRDLTDLGIGRGRVGVLMIAADIADVKGEGLPPDTRWVLVGEVFIDYGQHGRAVEGPHGTISLCVDADGRALGAPWMQTWSDPIHNELMKSFMTFLHPIYLAISFLHCRNVGQKQERVARPLAKKYYDRSGIWPTAYHTLVIEPLKQILRSEGRSHEVGLAKAMHICRGHFRDYRQGAGLFGKYKKLVWSPMTMRGTGRKPPAREIEVKI